MTRNLFTLIFLQLLVIVVVLLGLKFAVVPVGASVPDKVVVSTEIGARLHSKDLAVSRYAYINSSLDSGSEHLTAEEEQGQTCSPDAAGMLSYWPLDDGPDATTFVDVIGDNDGACTGINCPINSVGKLNSAFDFDSLDPDKINASADNPNLNWNGTDSFSFELWVKTTQVCTENKVFIGQYRTRDFEIEYWASWWIGCGDSDKTFFSLRDSLKDSQTITSTVSINDGNWHHIVAGRDGTTNLLYVDGHKESFLTHAYDGDFFSENDINMGYYNVSPYYYFNGQLDEIAIYDRMLTPEEIEAHYNGGAGQSYCIGPPIAMDDSYTVAEDSSGNAFDVLANDEIAPDSSGSLTIIDVSAGSAGGSITTDGSHIFYIPSPDYFGTEIFSYTINDGNIGNNDSAMVTVTVTPVSDPPQVQNPGDQTSGEGDSVSLQILANDPDNDDLTYAAADLPAQLSINPATGLISGMISFDAFLDSPYAVNITVTDSVSPTLGDSTAFTWLVTNTNRSPVVSNPGEQTDAEGDSVSLPIMASDPDGDDVTFSAAGLPSGLSIHPTTGVISGTLNFDASLNSPYTVTVEVTDDGSPVLTGQAVFAWLVTNTNRSPVVSHPGNQSHKEGDFISLDVFASDPDGDSLVFSAVGLPDGLSIHPNSGVISGKVAYDAFAGSPFTTQITVTDEQTPALSASVIFTWTIVENTGPVALAPGDQANFVGDERSLQIIANDPDEDTLTYDTILLPPGLSIDPKAGIIWGILDTDSVGTWPVTVTISDGDIEKNAAVNFNWKISHGIFLPVVMGKE